LHVANITEFFNRIKLSLRTNGRPR